MAGVSLRESQYYSHPRRKQPTAGSQGLSPRLPTPEASRSSYETYDSDSPGDAARRASTSYGQSDSWSDKTRSRRDSRNQYSPPYQTSDVQRPSLPPLKTVLGDNLTSPPRTPSLCDASMQPSPREPSFTASTYKPPSLYPNKKQRTDFVLQPAPPTNVNNFSSPSTASAAFESNARGSLITPNTSFPYSSARFDTLETRQQYQPRDDRGFSRSSPKNAQYSPAMYQGAAGPRSVDLSSSSYYYRMPEQPATFNQSKGSSFQRTTSSGEFGDGPPRKFDHDRSRYASQEPESHYALPVRAGFADREPLPRFGHADANVSRPQAVLDYAHGPESSRSSFFMPSHYDYHHGKARKRSNLPKQSTEIMKTWFDQNISNPYPSEEQKAMFSSATGISMTQVSNWFINHRRRCPELRDKREKNRGRDCDF